jgi:DNA-binding response OmpR family regulator
LKAQDALYNQAVPAQVLLVCDDPETGRIWNFALALRGWQAALTQSAEEAVARWNQDVFDLIVIDLSTPHLDGVALIRQLRAEAVIPILLLTQRSDEAHLLEAYAAGASECLVKPLSPALFLAKVQAWLRTSGTVAAQTLEPLIAGQFRLDPTRREVRAPTGALVKLTNLEFRLLYLLMSHRGQVLESDTIIARVWGYAGENNSILLKNVIYRLRRKIEPDPAEPRFVQTVPGVGYVFYSP